MGIALGFSDCSQVLSEEFGLSIGMARKIRFQMNQVKFHSLGLQERDLKFNEGSLHLCTQCK